MLYGSSIRLNAMNYVHDVAANRVDYYVLMENYVTFPDANVVVQVPAYSVHGGVYVVLRKFNVKEVFSRFDVS